VRARVSPRSPGNQKSSHKWERMARAEILVGDTTDREAIDFYGATESWRAWEADARRRANPRSGHCLRAGEPAAGPMDDEAKACLTKEIKENLAER
jgi:hypothetical protein